MAGMTERRFRRSAVGRGLALAVFWLFLACPAGTWAAPDRVAVLRVFDGDTCQLADGRRLRLAGIDAPETGHGGAPAQYYAAEAASLLARLTVGQPLRLEPVGEGRDRFGRLLGDLVGPDGASVALRMLDQGAAYVFWHPDLPASWTDRALAAQRRAMAGRVGFWARILSLPAPDRPYVGNAASRRFHDPRCRDAGRIGPRNRVLLPDLAAAFGQGYAPARDCTPWPPAGDTAPAGPWKRKWP